MRERMDRRESREWQMEEEGSEREEVNKMVNIRERSKRTVSI